VVVMVVVVVVVVVVVCLTQFKPHIGAIYASPNLPWRRGMGVCSIHSQM